MIFNVWDYKIEASTKEITVRCPGCKQLGTFVGLEDVPDVMLPRQMRWPPVYLGHRRCPNTFCNAHVFFALQRDKLQAVYPPERLDFDKSGIPASVASSLDEGITCYAHGCYRASAMLVRRSLEEMCHERGVTGANLKARIDALGTSASLPIVLADALHNLRLLGNDAAHIESKDYINVGKEEVEIAITLTQNVLQVIYQYSILADKLKAKKR